MHDFGHALYEQGLDHEHRFARGAVSPWVRRQISSRFWKIKSERTLTIWKVVLLVVPAFPDAPDWDEHALNHVGEQG